MRIQVATRANRTGPDPDGNDYVYDSRVEATFAAGLHLFIKAGRVERFQIQDPVNLAGFVTGIDFKIWPGPKDEEHRDGAPYWVEVKAGKLRRYKTVPPKFFALDPVWAIIETLWKHNGPGPLHLYGHDQYKNTSLARVIEGTGRCSKCSGKGWVEMGKLRPSTCLVCCGSGLQTEEVTTK